MFVALAMGVLSALAQPDFAFPDKVEAQAMRDLDTALKNGHGSRAVNALVRLGLAKSAVSSDSLPQVIDRVEQLRTKVKGVDLRALLTLLEAGIYTDIYAADRWTYDARTPLASEGNDYRLWSRDRFFAKVSGLLREVLADAPRLLERPLIEFKDVVTFRREALTFYPTLWDFAAYQSIAYLERFDRATPSLPSALLFNPTDTSLFPAFEGSVTTEIMNFYLRLMQGRETLAPGVMALRNDMQFIADRIFVAEHPRFSFSKELNRGAVLRFEAFVDAYCRMSPSSEYAVELLLAATQGQEGEDNATLAYEMLRTFERDHPKYFNINEVKNRLAEMSAVACSVSIPSQSPLGKPLKVSVTASNTTLVTLGLYRVPATTDRHVNYYSSRQPLSNPISTVDVVFEGNIPFTAKATAEFTLPGYGRYMVAPINKDADRSQKSYPIVICSDISIGFLNGNSIADVVAVDAASGAPLQGVNMQFKPWSNRQPLQILPNSTDKDGFYPAGITESGVVFPVKGEDKYSTGINVWRPEARTPRDTTFAELFTPLGLYHFGDEVKWAALLYTTSPSGREVAPRRSLTVRLLNASHQEVDQQTVTTDASGRVESAFRLPASGLSGNFTLEVVSKDGVNFTSHRFMVSDYKLPTFMVKVGSVRTPSQPGSDAVIRGEAATFAGFPVEEAKMVVTLKVRTQVGWFGTVSPVFYRMETTTGHKGEFTVTIPSEVIAASPDPTGYFMAELAVTSPDGETATASTGFNLGRPLTISAEIPPVFDALQPPAARVRASDEEGDDVALKLRYLLQCVNGTKEHWTTDSGTCSTGSISRLIARLPSGSYRIIFAPQDEAQAFPTAPQSFTVWRRTDSQSPSKSLLWLPEERIVANSKGIGFLTFATPASAGDAWVLLTLSDPHGRMVMRKWVASRGMTRTEIPLPQGVDRLSGSLYIVNGCESANKSFTLEAPALQGKLEMNVATFRNKVVPGEKEEVTVAVRGLHGAPAASWVVAAMTNKAVDLLSPAPLGFVAENYPSQSVRLAGLSFFSNSVGMLPSLKLYDVPQITIPTLQTYGRSFGTSSRNGMVIAYGSKLSRAAAAMRNTEDAVEEMAMADEMVATAGAAAAGAAPKAAPEAENATGNADKLDTDNYRPSETPLAFFRPMLATDSVGNLTITYTVPDANTTWVLRTLAWNASLLSATSEVEIMSAKPVMVSANAPRFLRSGDTVSLLSSVMNARTETTPVVTLCELLDAASGKVLATASVADTIPTMERRVVALPFVVPADVNALILKVRATSGSYSDGEQVLIPVLPSEQNVVESRNFYIPPGQRSFEMSLEPVPNGRAYLNYTDNAAMAVVSALPGLRNNDAMGSSLSAAASLFSACVADGIMRSQPEVAKAVRMWAENPSDSALVSMLQKNAELKQVLLSATPWVADALSQTERMQRLVLLLDSRNTSSVVEAAIAALTRDYDSTGCGWGWTRDYPKANVWVTSEVLTMLGHLSKMGWLPADERLTSMIDGAVKYIDKQTASLFAAAPKADYTAYCLMRMKFPKVKQSSAAAAVVTATVRRCINEWKSQSVVQNAVNAIILNANGYNATARRILDSLTSQAVSTHSEGMWWNSLNGTVFGSLSKLGATALILQAYHAVNPSAPEIDKIRQWLLLNKSNNDWGNAVITSQVVASVLSTGSNFTATPASTAIRVGGELLQPSATFATGEFTEQITRMVADTTLLTIDRQGQYPSFGGVVTMRVVPMNEVEAVGSTQLAVSKEMCVWTGDGWQRASAFRLGDRVKVVLTLHVRTDMSYVVVTDPRAAGLEPVEQLPAPIWSEGLRFYRENRNSGTNIFIDRLPKGNYRLEYELFASQGGTFSSGVASVQSLYNPLQTAHSAGGSITVE